jgi:hypothetical protein
MKTQNLTILTTALLLIGCGARMDLAGTPPDQLLENASLGTAGVGLNARDLTLAEVQKACAERPLQRTTYPISFPKETRDCPWNTGDNLGFRDLYFQTRIEQQSGFTLPAGAIICDMTFNWNTNDFYYDDEFIFGFDGLVLASSFTFSGHFPQVGYFQRYNWSVLLGDAWVNYDQRPYCAGADRGTGMCSWPDTSVNGPFRVRFDDALIQELTSHTNTTRSHTFNFITTGDDNPTTDCKHEPVDFDVDVTYVQ